jgi:hypothetical protein
VPSEETVGALFRFLIDLLGPVRIPNWLVSPIFNFVKQSRDSKGIEASTQVARENGIDVWREPREVGRSYIGQTGLPAESVTVYRLRHQSPKQGDWALLQRDYRKISEYPGTHSPVFDSGELTPELDRLFRRISDDKLWQSMFIEVECTPDEVCIYWDGREGADAARQVIEWLHAISEAAD